MRESAATLQSLGYVAVPPAADEGATPELDRFEPRGADPYLKIRGPAGMGRYLVHKGSVAIDGISLTVDEGDGDAFAGWLIPHTLTVTTLRFLRAGTQLNPDFQLRGKHI